jgi:hypothetical protein
MFLKCDPYRVWCSIFYSKLVNYILLRSLFVFVKGRGTCGSGERNVKIWIDFRKSPRFSLTSPLSQGREFKSPCFYYVWWAQRKPPTCRKSPTAIFRLFSLVILLTSRLGVLSCNLSFFNHPIICKTVNYIDQLDDHSCLNLVLMH